MIGVETEKTFIVAVKFIVTAGVFTQLLHYFISFNFFAQDSKQVRFDAIILFPT